MAVITPVNQKEDRPLGWCRDERLRRMQDLCIERTDDYSLHECVDGMHKGQWIVWASDGRCLAVGSESWARRRISELFEVGR